MELRNGQKINSNRNRFQEGFLRELFVGAILTDDKVIGVIELKDHKTPDLASIENQAFGYKSKHRDTRLVIISNFEKLRQV